MIPEIKSVLRAESPELLSFLDRAFGFESGRNGFLSFLLKLYEECAEPIW